MKNVKSCMPCFNNNSEGISLIALIVTIIVIIILSSTVYVMNYDALNSTSEAKFKADLRGLMDRLKIYHEDANLASFKYKSKNLTWDGANVPENTGKVNDGENEDTADFIFGGIPEYFLGKISIKNGNLLVDTTKLSEDEQKWVLQMGLSSDEYYEWADLEFNGAETRNIIDTGIQLFSEENINKDFELIIRVGAIRTNTNQATLINAKQENSLTDATQNPGLMMRCSDSNNMEIGVNSIKKKISISNIVNKDFIIKRVDGQIFYQIQGQDPQLLSSVSVAFDTPLTIGGNINIDGEYDRFFNGDVDFMQLTIYNKNVVEEQVRTYARFGLVFNGRAEDVIDTKIKLFSAENINKDFEIKLKIKSYTNSGKQDTMLNAKYEVKEEGYPGFVVRLGSGTSGKPEFNKVQNSNAVGKEIKIVRKNGTITGYVDGAVWSSFDNPTKPFETTVVLGASVLPSGTLQRLFTGELDYVKIELAE